MYPTNCNVGNYNPYYQPVSQVQQSPSYARPMIIGKVVNKIEEVTPNDIPMDGSFGIFPLQDRSMIFLKRWNSDGTITTEKFIKEVVDVPKEPINDPMADEMLMLRQQLDRIEKALKAKPTTTKKEA